MIKKSVLFASVLTLGTLSSSAALASDTADTGTNLSTMDSAVEKTFSIEGFHGFDQSDNDLDVYGVSLRWTFAPAQSEQHRVAPEFFVVGNVGFGEENRYGGALKYRAVIATVMVGVTVNIELNDVVSVYARGQFGVSVVGAELKVGGTTYDNDDSGLGLAFGVGVGMQFAVTDGQHIVFGVDYIGTTVEPEFDTVGFTADKPEYIMLSVGYKWSF